MAYTRLDIINSMVASTGAWPFTAEQTRHPTYMKAERLLAQLRASMQSIGLWFNTEVREVKMQTNGEVIVPSGCIKADPVERKHNLSLRKSKMYDLDTGTYDIGCDLVLKMHFELDIEDMPLAAQEYLRALAVYRFFLNEDGGEPKLSSYKDERDTCWSNLYREHLRSMQTNIFDNRSNTVSQLRKGYPSGVSTINALTIR